MKNLFLRLFVIMIAIALVQSCNQSLVDNEISDELELKSADALKKGYIVTLKDDALSNDLLNIKGYENRKNLVKSKSQKLLQRAGITDGEIDHIYSTALVGFSVKIAPGQLKKLENDASVAQIEEDKVVSLVLPKGKPTESKKPPKNEETTVPPQITPWGIARVNGAVNGADKTAWVIDSGIDLDHPDLNVDQSRNRTFLGGNSTPDDQNGHGTHVAGTIAALDDNKGVVGVAAGATVVSVRVLDRRGSGFLSGVIEGVDYVAANGESGDVANMSLGGGVSTSLDNAVKNAAALNKVKFVLAAGNESNNADNHSPARVNGNNIYTISAMDSNDTWAYFSNYGPAVDYCAPGYRVESCYKNGGYATLSGTSMAAPHVAGILLLGSYRTDGNVIGDPDGNADPIAVH